LGASAVGQEAEAPVSAPAADIDVVVVPGRRPENLRIEIERLEVAVYDRFNALNSSDEFDIHCLEQAPTGSNITLRTCAPNYLIQAEAREATKMMTDGRGSGANNQNKGEFIARMQEKSKELTEEIQRVARQDEQLMRDLARLDSLKQLQESERAKR
jgi:hypothetical protein